MSLCTLPVLFFNMGGEMLYILDQRLRAQKVPQTKAVKVMRDIVGQMFDERCVKELFRPQKAFTKRSLRTVFDRLAHASIMKLNSNAMDKLYDLMLMATKYQVLLCKRGEDVILVTLNHLDSIRELVGDSEKHISMLNTACKTVTDFYSRLAAADFIQLRCTLLTVFQDTHKRVSVFLKTNAQQQNGRFVIPTGGPVPNGFEVPGTIRYFGVNGDPKRESNFTPLHKYSLPEPPGSWEIKGSRVISLGMNIYASEKSTEPPNVSPESSAPKPPVASEEEESSAMGDGVVAELRLLERLLVGFKQHPSEGDTFRLKLFPESDDDEEEKQRSTSKTKAVNLVQEINPSKKGSAELSKIMHDFMLQEHSTDSAFEDDLLDLMDKAT